MTSTPAPDPGFFVDAWNVASSNAIVSGTIAGVVVVVIVAAVKPLRHGLAAAGRWLRPAGTLRTAKPLPWVDPPQWTLRQWRDDGNILGLKNLGGKALHVTLSTLTVSASFESKTSWEVVEAGEVVPFVRPSDTHGGMLEIEIVVHASDANGVRQAHAVVRVPGKLL